MNSVESKPQILRFSIRRRKARELRARSPQLVESRKTDIRVSLKGYTPLSPCRQVTGGGSNEQLIFEKNIRNNLEWFSLLIFVKKAE